MASAPESVSRAAAQSRADTAAACAVLLLLGAGLVWAYLPTKASTQSRPGAGHTALPGAGPTSTGRAQHPAEVGGGRGRPHPLRVGPHPLTGCQVEQPNGQRPPAELPTRRPRRQYQPGPPAAPRVVLVRDARINSQDVPPVRVA